MADALEISPAEAASPGVQGVIRFGVFEMDRGTGELRKAGALVRLRQQSARVLIALLARPGQVVSRDDLRATLWGDVTFVDFDQGLNSCVKEVRAALNDSSDTPLYVETLPRRGYRFIAPVQTAADATVDVVRAAAVEAPPARSRWGAAHAALTVVALAAAGLLALRRPAEPRDWRQITFRRGSISGARFTPNGSVVLGAAWDGGPDALYEVVPGTPDARALAFEGARVVGVLRTGEIAYVLQRPGARSVLARAPLAGGPPKEILEDVTDADVARDGLDFAVIHAVAGRGTLVEYPIGHALSPVNAPGNVRISPTGRHVAVIERRTGMENAGWVLVLDAEGRRVAASPLFATVTGLAWAPDGEEVFYTASVEGTNTALRALDLRKGDRVVLPGSGRMVLHDVAGDGRALIERGTARSEVRFSGPGGERSLSWFDGGHIAALSPDGGLALLNETGEAGGANYGVYLRPTDGDPPVRLGAGRATGLAPDGRSAVTIAIPDPYAITLLPIGAGEVRRVTHPGIVQYEWARLLPDGASVVFGGGERNRNLRVWIGDLRGGPPRPITPEGFVSRSVLASIPARLIVAGCPPLRMCAYPFDGGEPRPLDGLAGSVPLSIDGSGTGLLVRPRGRRFPVPVARLDLRTGERTAWRDVTPSDVVGAGTLSGLIQSEDGRSFAYDLERRLSELYLVPGLPLRPSLVR